MPLVCDLPTHADLIINGAQYGARYGKPGNLESSDNPIGADWIRYSIA